MRRKDKRIIRAGDYVRIKQANMFIRCGYSYSFGIALEEVQQKYKDAIQQFLKQFDMEDKPHLGIEITRKGKRYYGYAHEKIERALAYALVQKKNFGGNVKAIYCEHHPELTGELVQVIEKRVVRTGTYYPPSGGYDSYSGEYDWEPGGLDNMDTHKILKINVQKEKPDAKLLAFWEIEERWVEKVDSNEDVLLPLQIKRTSIA